MALPEIVEDLQAQMRLQFGNVDLSDQSVFGQLIGIFAASSSQLWQAGAALYANSYPAGATGVAVDNLLALNNLSRLPEKATVTDPNPATRADGVILYGLRLLGTPGTVVPAGTLVSNGNASPITFALDAAATIAVANNARQVLYFGGQATTGSYKLTFTDASGHSCTTTAIPYSAQARVTTLSWPNGAAGSYTLTLGPAGDTATLDASGPASAVQAAINAVTDYGSATVSSPSSGTLAISWPAGYVPMLTAAGAGAPATIGHAIAAYVHALALSDGTNPFTDVLLTANGQAIAVDFGAYPPLSGMPATAASAIGRIVPTANTLAAGGTSIDVAAQISVVGSPAQAVASATATTAGPKTVLAGQLNTIATPLSGLSSVTNDLDCITGRNAESDADAIARFRQSQGSGSSGSLSSLVKKVQGVAGVSQVTAFQNTGNAAGQVLLFATPPTQGSYNLLLGGQTTADLAYNATPAQVQAAVRAIGGFGAVNVTAYGSAGFLFDFAGVRGDQAVTLIQVPQNTTQVPLSAYYGRPPHSVELVVEGGADTDIANAILLALPAGVATYSNPVLRTTATLQAGSNQIVAASVANVAVGQTVDAPGVPLGATVVALNESTVTLSAGATTSASNVPVAFIYAPALKDASGNQIAIGFSRPQSTVIYVVLRLVTDRFVTPGDSSSGLNASSQWDPSSVATIQQRLIDLINQTQIGGAISARGSNGLVGSFRDVLGVYDFSLAFGTSPAPTNTDTLQLQSNQSPTAQFGSVQISYS